MVHQTARTAEERAELIPHFAADVALLQELTGESFSDWLRAAPRTYKGEVKPVGPFGTAYQSIDRPLGEHRGRSTRDSPDVVSRCEPRSP